MTLFSLGRRKSIGENCEIGIPNKIPKVYHVTVYRSLLFPHYSLMTERPSDHVPNHVKL